jgi:hypothetical protein
MHRIVIIALLAGCTLAVNGPPKERKGAELVDCTTNYLAPVLDTIAFVADSTATIVWAKSDTFDDCEALGCTILPFGVVGMIVLPLVAAHGFDLVHRCRTTKERVTRERAIEEAAVKRADDRERAWRLTKQAATAARAGDCEAVREADKAVRAADEEFHATVFVRDVAIARCL